MVISVMYYVFQKFPAIYLHSGEGKTMMFTPHQVVIKDFKNPQNFLATGTIDNITRLYKFNNFGSSPFPSVFVAYSDNLCKIWHEQFSHLNYRSLQQLSKDNMVTGLLMVSCRDGVFVAYSNNLCKIWHERFGHLNYRSLQQLCKDNMVTGLLMVSCKDGVCSGCVLEKHHQDSLTNVHLSMPRFP